MTDVQNQVMRELLLNTHRETVSKFAVEIAMQLENQWKKHVCSTVTASIPTGIPAESQNRDVSFLKIFSKAIRRLLLRLSMNRKDNSLV